MLSYMIWPIISSIIAGAVLTSFYYLYFFIKNYIQNHFISAITIESSDNMFQWLLDYLLSQGILTKNLSNFACKIQRSSKTRYIWQKDDINQDLDKPKISYTPGSGYHSFLYKGLKVYFTHQIVDRLTVGYNRRPMTIETIKLFAYGKGHVGTLKQLCDEAMIKALTLDSDKTSIYALGDFWNAWDKVQSKRIRPLDSVILDSNIAEEITSDIGNFKQNQQWYIDRGVPYRRGYLLYGPPGTGKTSFLLALAGKLNLSICTVNLSGSELDDERLIKVLEKAPQNAVILLEDIDAIFVERTSVGQERSGRKVSFSGLLNALDGVRSQEGRVLFMTTNHIEKLDPALLRPGRADVHVKLDYATGSQIRRIFQKFYPDAPKESVEDFAKRVPENKLSMAKLQGHFLRYKNNPEKAIEFAADLIEINEYTNEMNIKDWLFRLGLEQHAEKFVKENIWRVGDLKGMSEDGLGKYGIDRLGDQKRVVNMLKGDDLAKKAFCFMSKPSIRALVNLYLSDQKEIESLVQEIPENCVTEFHLRDVFDEEGKGPLRQRIQSMVSRVEQYKRNGKVEKVADNPKKYPKENPEDVLTRLGMAKFVENFRKNNALTPEIFYELTMDNLERDFKVDLVGKRMKLMKVIEEAKEKELEEDEVRIGDLNVLGLIKQTSINY